MIKVEKNFEDVPNILKSKNRKEAFLNNVADKAYNHGKTLYKSTQIFNTLKSIYNLKCAYCEESLLDAPKHIEHYRPKDYYYWLSYSWDNLLFCCTSCNSVKTTNFKIENSKINYNNECFLDIHGLGAGYDELEKPLIINPEKDDVLDMIVFDCNGKMSSANNRVSHTINIACKLNREELVQRRIKILNKFKITVEEHLLYYQKKGDLSRFCPDIKLFIEECNKKNEFYSFRYFILNHIEVFFDDLVMRKILKVLIQKLK